MTIRESSSPENCIELSSLHKIIGSRRIPEKGVSIFSRGSEYSNFHVTSNQIYGGNLKSLEEVIHFIHSHIHSFIHSFIHTFIHSFFSILLEHLFMLASGNTEIAIKSRDEQYRFPTPNVWHIVGTK